MPTVTRRLLILNLIVFVLQMLRGEVVIARMALWPLGEFPAPEVGFAVGFEVWQPFTYAFLHGNVAHLVLNMFALFMFGSEVERVLGGGYFLRLYGAAVLVAAGVQLAVVTASGDVYPTVGASGGVFGILLAYGMLFPDRMVMLLLPPIPMKAKYFVILYGAVELVSGVVGTRAGIAHFAHLGGMLGGLLVLLAWKRRMARPRWPTFA